MDLKMNEIDILLETSVIYSSGRKLLTVYNMYYDAHSDIID